MTPVKREHRPILLLSPSTRGGSWRWIDEVVREVGVDKDCVAVAYGRKQELGGAIQPGLVFPFFAYENYGLAMLRHPILALTYNVPLLLLTYVAFLRWRPRLIMTNGIILAAACKPYAAISRAKVLMAFHGHIGPRRPWFRSIVRRSLRHVRRAFEQGAP